MIYLTLLQQVSLLNFTDREMDKYMGKKRAIIVKCVLAPNEWALLFYIADCANIASNVAESSRFLLSV